MGAIARFFKRQGLGGRPIGHGARARTRLEAVIEEARRRAAPTPDNPAPPVDPGTPAPVIPWRPFRWFFDDLTLRDDRGRVRWICSYAFHDDATRAEDLALLRARGYNMTFVDQLDYIDKSTPVRDGILELERLVGACRELQAAGIKAVPRFGYEDGKHMLAAIGGVNGYLPHLRRAADALVPYVDGWCLGKESFERFTPDDVLTMVALLRPFGKPIAIHLGQGERGPAGREAAWWRDVVSAAGGCPVAIAYQCRHPKVEDGGGAFTSDYSAVFHEIAALVAWCRPLDVAVVCAEHSYPGAAIDSTLVAESHAQTLGKAALEAGAVGTTNGVTRDAIANALARDVPAAPAPGPSGIFPGASWVQASPADVGVDGAALAAISEGRMGALVAIRGGREFFYVGDVDERRNTASCCRSFLTLAWLSAIREGLIPRHAIDAPLVGLAAPSAKLFEADVTLAHLLSYTGGFRPAGSGWTYSGGRDARGKHWPRQHALFAELVGFWPWEYLNRFVFPVMGGGLVAEENVDDATGDRTLRVDGSMRDMGRWAYLFLRGGVWNGTRIMDAELVARAIAGGPQGDGYPNPVEGWQIHLIRSGLAWEMTNLNGVPDAFMARDGGKPESSKGAIIGIPSLDLVIAYRSRYNPDAFLAAFCAAVRA